ncbi:hypothetical protein [uncultured Psychromonas sp.]|uniref:hypothetical protein n=1 Tax=uncultured Psychromonas sp. TaxID=173974 RepID=UPI002613C105|nr:hypothetical protein [uncultured Psychromonas sp.]
MYSEKMKPKVEKMFNDLRVKTLEIADSNSANDVVSRVCQRVSSETTSRSKTMLSDMLFDLNDSLLQTSFFTDISRQNKFMELNLRKEILGKYQFTTSNTIDYQEASRIMQAIKVGSGTLVIGGACEIGVVLIAGLSLSSLVPVPVGILIVAAFAAALVDYFIIEPNRNKKNISQAIDKYLIEAQQQFLNWFDEVENYFNKRVDELKQTI